MTVTIIDPTRAQRTVESRTVASPVLPTLAGKRVGLLENTKRNAAAILDALGRALDASEHVGTLVPFTKTGFALPLPDDLLAEIERSCDAVVIGVGDCGSCSASAIADGIALEARGIPTAVICTDAFVTTSQAMAALQGRGDYPFLLTEHPIANLTADDIDVRSEALAAQVRGRLTEATGGAAAEPAKAAE